MNERTNEWNEFINESGRYPDGLSHTEDRLKRRIKKENRSKNTLVSTVSAVAAALIFVILVNISTAFANVVSEVPVLGKIAEFVKFDKSLSNAVKNDYIQELGLTAWDGQNKLMLPYVIADEKNLVLFYQLPEDFEQEHQGWVNVHLKSMTDRITGEKVEGFSSSSSSLSLEDRKQNDGLLLEQFHFSEGILPRSIEIQVEVEKEITGGSTGEQLPAEEAPPSDIRKRENVYLTDEEFDKESDIELVGTFSFVIDFDEFAKPVIYKVNEQHTIMGQKITIDEMAVYPTGTEVKFTFSKENTFIINGLELTVEQEGSPALEGVKNGISASYGEDNSGMSVYIESNYFEEPENQVLLIKGARLIDKDKEYITVDLNNRTITPHVDGMELKDVIKHGSNATLIFSTKVSEDGFFGVFFHEYRDAEGNSYSFRSEGSTVNAENDSLMETMITVKNPESGKIILRRALSPQRLLEEPIRIKLPD